MLARQREPEGPFGEFPGYYSGCHNYPVIEIDRVSHRKDPIYDSVYVGRPWTELDYLQAMTTSAPIFVQLNSEFPEVVAVNALYTHGLVVIVSTKTRYGGFAKAVGLRVLTTTHGLGYAKVVIVVDADVDPFNLNQVMWAMSVKVNPSGRRDHRAESRGESARPCLFPNRNGAQDDHRRDHADRPRYSRQLRAGAGQAAGHRGVARQARCPDEGPAEMSAATTDQPSADLPPMPVGHDGNPQHVAGAGCLDRLRLPHLPLRLAIDRTRAEHQPGQISRGLSAEPRKSQRTARFAGNPAAATAASQIVTAHPDGSGSTANAPSLP